MKHSVNSTLMVDLNCISKLETLLTFIPGEGLKKNNLDKELSSAVFQILVRELCYFRKIALVKIW